MDITGRAVFAFMVRPEEAELLRLSALVTTTAGLGGTVVNGRFIAVFTAPVPDQVRAALVANGVEVLVAPAEDSNPVGRASPLFHVGGDWDVLITMDVASAVAGDFSGFIDAASVAARPAGRNPLPLPVWRRLLEHMGLRMPTARCVTSSDYTASIPYFDPGFLVIPAPRADGLRSAWQAYAVRLQRDASRLDLGEDLTKHLIPLSLSLAVQAEGVPVRSLPLEAVFPTDEPVHPALYPDAISPAVLRYGSRLDGRGLLHATPYAGPNRAVARINSLLGRLDGDPGGAEPVAAPRAPGAPAPEAEAPTVTTMPGGALVASKRTSLESFVEFTEGGDYPRYPLEVFLEVSNVCDLKCAMCRDFSLLNPNRYEALRNQERGFIDKEDFAGAMDEVLEHALVVHCFGFGEPTIHPQFRELIDYLSRFEVALDFFTNGMHLTQELCDFLVERKVAAITISFSGATKADYENVYQGGEYERVLGGIARLAQTKRRLNSQVPNIIINSLSFQHHIDTLPEFVAMMASHGVNHIFVKQLNGQADNPVISGHIAVNRPWVEGKKLEQAKAVAKQLGVGLSAEQFEHSAVATEEEARRRKAGFVMGGKDGGASEPVQFVPISRFKEIAKTVKPRKAGERGEEPPTVFDAEPGRRAALLGMTAPAEPVKHPCMEPFKTLYVRKNGRVKSCCFHDSLAPALGDVGRQSGIDVWRGPGFRLMRDGVVAGEYPAGCQTCLDIGYGPWSHFLRFVAGEYDHWYRQAFEAEFLPGALRQRVVNAAENAKIIARRSVSDDAPLAARGA